MDPRNSHSKLRGGFWTLLTCYCPAARNEKGDFWNMLCLLIKEGSTNWACIGDFNEVLTQVERQGGHPVTSSKNFLLQLFLDEVQGVDIGFTGNKYTWCNKRGGLANIRERLDRVISSIEWRTNHGNARVTHLNAHHSDHAPLILNLNLDHPRLPRPFRFQKVWKKRDSTCYTIVKKAWSERVENARRISIGRRISNTAKALQLWNKKHFGFCKERIFKCEKRIQWLQSLSLLKTTFLKKK